MKARSRRNSVAPAAAVVMLGGCALSSVPDAKPAAPSPAPRQAPREVKPSHGAEPVQVFISRGTLTDSDADGYADTIPVVAYLFPDPGVSHLPVWTDGEFEFRLIDANQQLFARWIYPSDMAATARQQLPPGPAYSFFLRLGGEDDHISRRSMELSAIFRSTSGLTVSSNGSAAVQLGLD
jgi:hypothetical protein